MTGDAPVPTRPALWAALSQMQIEEPGASRRFEEALAEEQGWSLHFAERVTDEYRRFLYLAATAPSEVTPSRTVDEAWHLHLATPHYPEVLCRQILGRPLEHRPAIGEPGEEERHRRQYEETLELYERAFGRPPADIWPRPTSSGEEDLEAIRRQGRQSSYRIAFIGLAGSGLALAFGAWELALALLVGALIFFLCGLFAPAAAARGRGSGGCGGGGCAGGSKDAGGGDASCGGGCGGD